MIIDSEDWPVLVDFEDVGRDHLLWLVVGLVVEVDLLVLRLIVEPCFVEEDVLEGLARLQV